MQSLDILFLGMDCVFIDDFLVKFLEFGEIFDEIEVVYV